MIDLYSLNYNNQLNSLLRKQVGCFDFDSLKLLANSWNNHLLNKECFFLEGSSDGFRKLLMAIGIFQEQVSVARLISSGYIFPPSCLFVYSKCLRLPSWSRVGKR